MIKSLEKRFKCRRDITILGGALVPALQAGLSGSLVEMMAERGLALSCTTILRWVERFMPKCEKRWNLSSVPR